MGGNLFFSTPGSLWKSDGTTAGTVLVKNVAVANLTNVNGTLFFAGNDGTNGTELWKSDGTSTGTVLVKDIFTGKSKQSSFISIGGEATLGGDPPTFHPNSSSPADLTNVNGRLYFTATNGTSGKGNGRELWTSDGTAAGTVLVKDIYPGSGSSTPAHLTNVNGLLYFTAIDGVHGRELWQSDGTAAGTVMVQDINPGSASSNPTYLVALNNKLYFSADDGAHGRELWDPPPVEPSYTLGPLVQVSSTSFFASCTEPPPPGNYLFLHHETEPQLAVDPTNPEHIVGLWHQDEILPFDGFRGQVLGVSFDGGATWHLSALPGITSCSGGALPQAADPWLSFAPNGDLYASSMSLEGPFGLGTLNRSRIIVTKSSDGGLSWGAPAILIDDANGIVNDKESITADPTNPLLAYATWLRGSLPPGSGNRQARFDILGGKGTSMFTRTTDGGRTWEPARIIYDAGANALSHDNQIVVLPNGTLIDFFSEVHVFNNSDGATQLDANLALLRSPDKGQTWLPHGTPIRAAKMFRVPVVDPENGLPVLTSSDDNGAFPFFDVTVDPRTGSLYAVWEDARFSGGRYNSIAFSQSTDGGLSWSDPIAVNKTPTKIDPGNRQAFVPSVAVAADGTVAVTYYDFRRNDDKSGLATDYWAVFGHAGTDLTNPASWGSELRLTNTSFDMRQSVAPGFEGAYSGWVGHYQGLSSAGNDFVALFAQAQTAADPSSIFFRRIGAVEAEGPGGTAVASATGSGAALLAPAAVTDRPADVRLSPEPSDEFWMGGAVRLLLGTGDGPFSTTSTLAVADGPRHVVPGDVSRDGEPDRVSAKSEGTLRVPVGTGGTFEAAGGLAADDLGDSWPDLAVPASENLVGIHSDPKK